MVIARSQTRSQSHCYSISQRAAGMVRFFSLAQIVKAQKLTQLQIFLDTPHGNDVHVWADRIQKRNMSRVKISQDSRTTQTLETAENFAQLTKDFQQLSPKYMIIYFCNEEWLECSGATVSRPLSTSTHRFV